MARLEPRVERRDTRFKALARLYREKNCGEDPQDKYDVFILRILQELGEVYDDNMDMIHALRIANYGANKKKIDALLEREDTLNGVGHYLRRALRINIPEVEEEGI